MNIGFCCKPISNMFHRRSHPSCQQWIEVSQIYNSIKGYENKKIWRLGLPDACRGTPSTQDSTQDGTQDGTQGGTQNDTKHRIICSGNDVLKQAKEHADRIRSQQSRSSALSTITSLLLCTLSVIVGLLMSSYLLSHNN